MRQGFAKGQKQLDAGATSAVLKLIKKFQEMLGAGHVAPPTIVWKSEMGARTLGRQIVRGPELQAIADGKPAKNIHSTIELQRIILSNESTLARILAHETIHHVEDGLMTQEDAKRAIALQRAGYRDPSRGHGAFFLASAKKINDLVGDPSFVTVTSDESYERAQSSEKPYFLYVTKLSPGRYAYAWTTRIGPSSKDFLVRKIREGAGFLVTTTDLYWSERGVKLTPNTYVSIPSSDKERMMELEALFEGGNPEYSLALIRAPRENPNALGVLPARPLGQTLGRRPRR